MFEKSVKKFPSPPLCPSLVLNGCLALILTSIQIHFLLAVLVPLRLHWGEAGYTFRYSIGYDPAKVKHTQFPSGNQHISPSHCETHWDLSWLSTGPTLLYT